MKNLSLICVLLVVMASARAQSDLQNTGILYISGSSDIVYVTASMTNASTGALTNNGSLYVAQTLTNGQSSMAIGTGTLYLNGSASQSVAGTQPFKTYNLTTDNAAGIVLNANLDVSNVHTFTNGVITTSVTPNYLIYEAGASHTGDADSKHVNGWVKKFGTTNFIFPVGNGSVERTVSVINLSGTSEFNVRHNMTTPNTSNLQAPLVNIDNNEYWTINRISGGTAQIFMNWDNSKVPFPNYALADIRAGYYNAGLWTNQGGSATGNVATTGTITSNTMNAFGNFTFGSISAILSVNFLSIRGHAESTYNVINWKTAAESMIDHFEIQRSDDGLQFSKIGVKYPTNTSGSHEYEFDDLQPQAGVAWYRILNIDVDGHIKFSSVIKIESSSSGHGLQLVNNPVQTNIYLTTGNTPDGTYGYELFAVAGELIQKGTLAMSKNSTVSIPLGQRSPAGTYILRISNSQTQWAQKIIIK